MKRTEKEVEYADNHDIDVEDMAAAVEEECDNVSEDEGNGYDNSAKMSEEQADWRDRFLRLSAEFDNYRKRTLREKMELVASGGEDVMKAMLPFLDDMDRALEAIESSTAVDSLKEGVTLITHKFRDTLGSKGVTEIAAVGELLDTDLHEAVALHPAGDENRGKIIDVVQKGYKMKDKVIRHAKVIVGE